VSPLDPEVPPVGEEIHLPGGSIQPLLLTVGITMALVGITLSVVMLIAGSVLSVLVIIRWVQDCRRDIDALPLEHHH
jgi:membrane protein implicated in regulation of membrane protease activity